MPKALWNIANYHQLLTLRKLRQPNIMCYMMDVHITIYLSSCLAKKCNLHLIKHLDQSMNFRYTGNLEEHVK